MLCSARRFLLRNLFPHICITLFHLSIFVSVCAFSPPLWRMINISVKCHFSSRPVYSPCLHQGFELSCPPGASALAEASAYMHSRGHTCADTHTHTHTHTPSFDPNSFYHVSKHSCASKPLFATLQITQLPRAWSSCPREPCSFIM